MSSLNAYVFSILQGVWDVQKIIDGNEAMRGIAEFSAFGANAYICKESGNWANGQEYFQETRYILTENLLELSRETTMFQLNFQKCHDYLVAEAMHQCHNDHYHLTFKIISNNQILQSYAVKGPRKDYAMDVLFKRK